VAAGAPRGDPVRFPGGKYLHGWDLATQRLSMDDLLRSCQQVGLTGFAEIKLGASAGMVLYYMGSEVSAVYREGSAGYQGQDALRRLRASIAGGEGSVSMYELPLEMAHLLRGLTNRRRAQVPVRSPADLETLLGHLRQEQHTGLLEVQTDSGAAALLVVGGRISNMYWEGVDGGPLEGAPAMGGLQSALLGDEALVFVSDFSREAWKSRREVPTYEPPTIEGTAAQVLAPLVDGDVDSRDALLRAMGEQIPSMLQGLVFDLMTKGTLARRIRGTAALPVMQIAERLPTLVGQIRDVLAVDGEGVELIDFQSARTVTVVALMERTQEGVAVIADKAQPTYHIAVVLDRLVRAYLARIGTMR
jgi:hypothetical protein